MSKTHGYLVLYSAVVTAAFLATVLFGFGRAQGAPPAEITVQRINLVEPDGTLRMVISNHARLPGVIVRGEERPLERPQAGILFLNDESSEIGGLIFGGRKNAAGEIVDSGASLSFDRYEANQIVQLIGVDDAENHFAGLAVLDSPSGTEVHRRIWLGRGDDGIATLALMDGAGRKRLVLRVTPEGTPQITTLDEAGEVVREVLPVTPDPSPDPADPETLQGRVSADQG
jgi:hypothetical protein